MLLKILGTIFSKGITAIIGFLIVVITSQQLGASIRGEIAILVLNISIIGLFQGIFNGASLIYLTPRFSFAPLFILSNLFAIIVSILLSYCMVLSGLIDHNLLTDLMFLGISQGLLTTSQSLLLGKEKIHLFNFLEIAKTIVLIITILFFFFVYEQKSMDSVVKSYFISYLIPFFISLLLLFKQFTESKWKDTKNLTFALLKYGFEIQVNNISQMINYRLCFFFIEKFKGKEALGVFSVAISLAEAVWIICKSIATFQYSKIVNISDAKTQKRLTLQSMHISILFTIPVLIVLLLLPDSIFKFVFGVEFGSLRLIILSLSLGILELAFFTFINHYFTGIGKNKINIYASLIGNIATIVTGILLIPYLGNVGAGITTSIAYLTMLLYLSYRFVKESGASYYDLVPKIKSIRDLFKTTRLS
ncbi:MAG: hypothetical protein RI883_1496 [Bacteroidota bacterium]|jgi:O-antigen/teichoic acid export membrane protein